MKVIELFAGIGSQALALKNIGIEVESIVSEIDKFAYNSYRAIHGDTINLGDICKIAHLPKCELLTYSFPCQDLSTAGLRKGMNKDSGTRSALLWEVGRLLCDAKDNGNLPKYLLMENVDAILNKKNFIQFQEWINLLKKLGYTSTYKVLNAKDFGIPQNRKRCFMVSSLDGKEFIFPEGKETNKKIGDFLESSVDDCFYLSEHTISTYKAHKERNEKMKKGFGWRLITKEDVASTVKTKPESDFVIEKKDNEICIRRLTPKECWRLMGFSDEIFNKVKEIPTSKTQLYKQAGNSIVVPCLEAIFKAMFIEKTWKNN